MLHFAAGALRSAAAVAACLLAGLQNASAQAAYFESEPNDTPAQGNAVAGEVRLYGNMTGGDQDAFVWTVSDDDARKRWTFELQGVPGKLTIVEIVRVEFADNGMDVAGYEKLMKIASRDGSRPVIAADLIFEPGEYLLGLAGSSTGGGAPYRPPAASLSFSEGGAEDGDASSAADGETDSAYRLTIRKGSRLAVSKEAPQNRSTDEALGMRLGREHAAFDTEPSGWYAFTFDESAAASRWDITAQAPVGRSLKARLLDAEGATLATASSDSRGQLVFPDLAPDATTWHVELTASEPGFIAAISSTAVGQRVAGAEAEPNGEWALATRVDLSQPVTGRINADNEWDYFRITVDDATADQVLALRIDADSPGPLEFCLLASDNSRAQCRRAETPVELDDLVLDPGDWGLSVTRAKEGLEYSITFAGKGAVQPGVETEPNDSIDFASTMPANNRIKGRISGDEHDYFSFIVADEPQLWRFQVIGDNLTEVGYYDGSRKQIARARPQRGQARIRLDNMFLLPGQHFIRIAGHDGASYTLLARAMGRPDPNAEREPNDNTLRMMRLAVGQTRTGLLAEQDDVDFYRFFLAAHDRVRLVVQPPADGAVKPYLYWYDKPLANGQPAGPGEPVAMDGLFPPGDYQLRLTPVELSDAEYRVSLERLPRFSCPADCEPTGLRSLDYASPLPPNLVIEGNAGRWSDTDVYQLPAFDAPTEMLIKPFFTPVVNPVGPPREVRVARYIGDTDFAEKDPATGGWRAVLPAGEAYRLVVRSDTEDYAARVEFPDGPVARPTPAPLTAELELDFEHDEIAAYRTYGQRVPGELRVRNSGTSPLDLSLAAATSDYRWQVVLDEARLQVSPGAEHVAPVTVLAPPDAWANRTARISIKAEAADGAWTETWNEIGVGRDAPRVNPVRSSPVPEVLRGGFNVGWSALGGELWGEHPRGHRFEQVNDGKTVSDNSAGFSSREPDAEPPAFTIALEGDGPVPVAGVALNLFGSKDVFTDVRNATLLLSRDGEQFEEALAFETLPLRTEQYFELAAPVMARYARLRIDSTFDRTPGGPVTLGEWKVITDPGFDLSAGRGINIADRALGGHVVWADPQISVHWDHTVLTETLEKPSVRLHKGRDLEWVLGFHHNRIALLDRLEWVEDPSTKPEQRFESVTVSASLDSPVGPWTPVALWKLGLERPAELALPQPVWARYLKFTAPGPDNLSWWYAPDTLRVHERPSDEHYRSILTEWGHSSRAAYYESQQPFELEPVNPDADNTSKTRSAELPLATTVASAVARGVTEHWYRLRIPDGHNSLKLRLGGDPTVRTVLDLQSAEGTSLPLREDVPLSSPDNHVFDALVDGGTEYYLRVEEPPLNIAFTWDTSASVISYLPTIYNSLAAFASEVVPGREAVNLLPFSQSPLLEEYVGEPYMLHTILNDFSRGSSSSAAESTLRTATQSLAPLAGTKAILVITDAATTRDNKVWKELRDIKPSIFGIGVGGSGSADEEQDRFQDWTGVNGGHYSHLVYNGEMEVAFDRATALLRRPATYELTAVTAYEEAPGPGRLTVIAGAQGERHDAVSGTAVELILDASGSMLQRMDGRRRIEIAREVLTTAIREHVPAGTPMVLRVFGHQEPNACRSDLEIPLAPLDPDAAAATIAGIQAMNLARTPIADSLAAVGTDLAGADGGAVVVLVTDGEETCDGDPAEVIASLVESGMDVHLNIVGFAIDDAELEAQFTGWADQGGGRYFPAADQQGLSEALGEALRVSYTVFDASGERVMDGVVGGDAVELERGTYRVVVSTNPPVRFENVAIGGEDNVTLSLSD